MFSDRMGGLYISHCNSEQRDSYCVLLCKTQMVAKARLMFKTAMEGHLFSKS